MPVSFEPPQYEEVELDYEESQEALRVAREAKYFLQQRIAYAKKLDEQETFITKTAEELFESLLAHGLKFADEKHTIKVKQLCCYFANDKRFNGDLSKGLLMMGKIGNGKTTIMKMFQANMNHSFRVVSLLDVTFDYKMNGEEGVRGYNANYTRSANLYGSTNYGYCFDDLGTEEIPARHYGESKNIFAEILQMRYNNRDLTPFSSTHATTNKNETDLLNLYGSRTYDRMKEMFNIIVFEHGSFR